jgi:hypothetical protein
VGSPPFGYADSPQVSEEIDMKIVITPTQEISHMDGIPVRVWKGETESGVACRIYVHRVAVQEPEQCAEFEGALNEEVEHRRIFR